MTTYALITGASKGIGKSIAFGLASRHYNLLLIARSENELRELQITLTQKYNVKVEILALDLSAPESASKVIEWITFNSLEISVLVNNAGYGLWGNFEELSLESQINMLQLNINTVVELSHKLIPLLKKQPKAYILNIASTAAYQAVPTLALYSASKAFVLSFSRAIRFELKKSSVSVTCISPGPVDTGFAERAGLNIFNKMAEKFNMKSAEVAEIAITAMLKRKSEVIPGITNIISAYANRILPKSFIEKTAAGLYKV